MAAAIPKILVLDAMGVIYRVGDDVADLLVPVIRENGGLDDVAQIESAYIEASLGRIDAAEFWRRVQVAARLEDKYLERLELSLGILEFLEGARSRFDRIACLSNDVSVWSRKLRTRFGLDRHITDWYISGDLGTRKPSPDIYRRMQSDLKAAPADILFVDDRAKNLHAAAALGMQTFYFDPANIGSSGVHRVISRFAEILDP